MMYNYTEISLNLGPGLFQLIRQRIPAYLSGVTSAQIAPRPLPFNPNAFPGFIFLFLFFPSAFIVLLIHQAFFLNQPSFPLKFLFKLFFSGKIKHVFGGEKLFAVVQHGIAGNGLILFGTENEPDGRVVSPSPLPRSSYMRT